MACTCHENVSILGADFDKPGVVSGYFSAGWGIGDVALGTQKARPHLREGTRLCGDAPMLGR